ncbi:DNA polymerase III subunit chi [Komagataeibacter rhaeticus]|uniref:DNA polymerase III subunit chi n=1 Tax=Komagataeibacter rhaeticus TaxID=215221 RepID=A0A181CC98_9PROT|nr:DNA polymerase III subunit chi [Komagataeibacter rhaeticus]ATU71986.1 DNA polymerase III subunit chi [Komagataeibacter xylinus]EGG75396.1 DNA polymerase III subunit chi [Gluconacetobacter sp. SXCC-1]KDU95721.1 DNA polymerase III subunit chi [Komagataeibacter rhaeticus AF1]MBL7239398.1 DNA polymerase III subunit chi [Komagataeibacter rhaeticus]PYD54592.1 DNA polymerase III subunit chi [Komagataeibacter rhaeticus]
MAQIDFYHLTRSTALAVLPELLGRVLASDRRAVIRCATAARAQEIDEGLWRATSPLWLPHGTQAMGHGPWQPIWLTAGDDVPNGATFLFVLDGVEVSDLSPFERVFEVFDGHDEAAVAAARRRWVAGRAGGHDLRYWQQQPKGWARRR